jgi:hypothetical protein
VKLYNDAKCHVPTFTASSFAYTSDVCKSAILGRLETQFHDFRTEFSRIYQFILKLLRGGHTDGLTDRMIS